MQCCVTSPPYWGLRDYGVAGQIGLESSVDAFLATMVEVFREVRRVLRDDGTLWLNMGDSYASHASGAPQTGVSERSTLRGNGHAGGNPKLVGMHRPARTASAGYKPKDLLGVPWMLAFALRADGWWLRQDVIWAKPNPMPESVRDRCTKAHEYLFLLSKRERYYFNTNAIAEPAIHAGRVVEYDGTQKTSAVDATRQRTTIGGPGGSGRVEVGEMRNRRSVWTIASQPFSGSHFATFPPALVEPCILAGSRPGDMVLDPFGGAGTTGLVADRLQRNATLIELNPEYAAMARARIAADAPLLSEVA
ncbi:MAG: site-specific DNA-methyltransferase [Candidatus Eisenbacteria bacterium]